MFSHVFTFSFWVSNVCTLFLHSIHFGSSPALYAFATPQSDCANCSRLQSRMRRAGSHSFFLILAKARRCVHESWLCSALFQEETLFMAAAQQANLDILRRLPSHKYIDLEEQRPIGCQVDDEDAWKRVKEACSSRELVLCSRPEYIMAYSTFLSPPLSVLHDPGGSSTRNQMAYTSTTVGCGSGRHVLLMDGSKYDRESDGCHANHGCWEDRYYRCCKPSVAVEESEADLHRFLVQSEGSIRVEIDSSGFLGFPSDTVDMIVEVGAVNGILFHSWLADDSRRFVVSFEPNIRGMVTRRHARQIFVHAAVAPKEAVDSNGFVTLDLAKESDLAMDLAMVPAVLLFSLLARIPLRIRIPLVQVRTAANDMQVLASAGVHLERVERIAVKCSGMDYEKEKSMYADGNRMLGCWTLSERLARSGFLKERCIIRGVIWVFDNPSGVEMDCIFARQDLHHGTCDWERMLAAY